MASRLGERRLGLIPKGGEGGEGRAVTPPHLLSWAEWFAVYAVDAVMLFMLFMQLARSTLATLGAKTAPRA